MGPTPAPTPSPTLAHQDLYDILVANSHDNGVSLANETSPQFWAAQQILHEPHVTSYSQDRLLQRYAMGVFYHILVTHNADAFEGANFTDECSWDGIDCNGFGQVLEMNIRWNGLLGYLPPELALLSTLSTCQKTSGLRILFVSFLCTLTCCCSASRTGWERSLWNHSNYLCPVGKLE